MSTALVPITGTSVKTVTANVFVYDKKADQWVSITPVYTGTVAPPPAGGGGGGTTGPHTHVIADILDWPVFSAVAFSGEWLDIRNRPNFSAVAMSGEYKDLLNAPVLAPVAKTGLWSDLTGAPVLSTIATSGKYTDLTGAPVLTTVATTGSYNDLKDKPTIPTVPVKGILAGTNVTVTELNGVFTINSAGGGGTGTLTQVNSDWSATTGVAKILNKPVIPAKVSELTNDSAFVNTAAARAAAPIQSLIAGANVVLTNDGAGNFTIASSGGGGGGVAGVSAVSATAPIHVANPTTTPALTIDDATSTTKGVVRFATAAEVTAGTAGFAVDAAALLNMSMSRAPMAHTHTVASIRDFPTLSTVATSGRYQDLTGTPTIPAAQVSSDWSATSGVAQILNKPTIPTKGSDLTNDLGWVTATAAAAAAPVKSIVAGANITVADDGSGNITVNATAAPSGGGGTGGVTNVSGTAPIVVQNGTTTPSISVSAATTTKSGVVQLATAADANAGTASRVVDAALLKSVSDTIATGLAAKADAAHTHVVANITDFPTLAAVATSGSYADLTNKPTIPAAQVQSDWNATTGLGVILNKPTIPAAQVQPDWTASTGMASILHKPTLATVATSGSYNDLTDKPTISAGGVTNVTGTAPISVATGTTTPVVSVASASTTAEGVVRLATAAEATAGTAGVALDAAEAKAKYAPIAHTHDIPNTGTPAAPGLPVHNDPNSGILANHADSIGLVAGGKMTLAVQSDHAQVNGAIYVNQAALGQPSIIFGGSATSTFKIRAVESPMITAWSLLVGGNAAIDAREELVALRTYSGTNIQSQIMCSNTITDINGPSVTISGKTNVAIQAGSGGAAKQGFITDWPTNEPLVGSVLKVASYDATHGTAQAEWGLLDNIHIGGTVAAPGLTSKSDPKTGLYDAAHGLGFSIEGVSAGGLSKTGGWSFSSGEVTTNAMISVSNSGIEIRPTMAGNPAATLKIDKDNWPSVKGNNGQVLQYDHTRTLAWASLAVYDRARPTSDTSKVELWRCHDLLQTFASGGWSAVKAKINAAP